MGMEVALLKEQLGESMTKRLSGQSGPKFCASSQSGNKPFAKGKKTLQLFYPI